MTSEDVTLKQCSCKENCVHPEGSLLPCTEEYFYLGKKRGKYVFHAKCKMCEKARQEEYRKRPEVIQRAKEYNARPEQVENRKVYQANRSREELNEYQREYRSRPEVIEKIEARQQSDSFKEYQANYRNDPEHKRRKRELAKSEKSKRYAKEYREREGSRDYFTQKQREYRQTENYRIWSSSIAGIAARFRAYNKRRKAIEENTTGTVTTEALNELLREYEGLCFYCGVNKQEAFDHVIPISRGGLHDIENLVPACKRCNSSKSNKLFEEEWLPEGWS